MVLAGEREPRVISDPLNHLILLCMLTIPGKCRYSLTPASVLNDCCAHVAGPHFRHLDHPPEPREDSAPEAPLINPGPSYFSITSHNCNSITSQCLYSSLSLLPGFFPQNFRYLWSTGSEILNRKVQI